MKNKLIHFANKEVFDEKKSEIPDYSICFIQDANKIYTHNTEYSYVNWQILSQPFIKSNETIAGDICLYDLNSNVLRFINPANISQVDYSKYSPIGVVVVPGVHDVYGDGSCSIVSLQHMNYNSPETGSAPGTPLYFGPQVDIPLTNYTKVVVYTATRSLTTNNFGYLCKDGVWNYETVQIPDPHNSDGNRNPEYYSTSGYTNSTFNALSDFKGKSNTNTIITKRGIKDYSSWTLTNTAANYPAASACDMYYTIGTNQGDWYLPSAGELGYIMSRWNNINGSIDALNSIYGNAYRLIDENGYWTSTENAGKNQRYVHMSNGVGYSNKDTQYSVVAFCNISTV